MPGFCTNIVCSKNIIRNVIGHYYLVFNDLLNIIHYVLKQRLVIVAPLQKRLPECQIRYNTIILFIVLLSTCQAMQQRCCLHNDIIRRRRIDTEMRQELFQKFSFARCSNKILKPLTVLLRGLIRKLCVIWTRIPWNHHIHYVVNSCRYLLSLNIRQVACLIASMYVVSIKKSILGP